jgi:hypothetical protein
MLQHSHHRKASAPALPGWRAKFADPIPIAGGRPIYRLGDAARFIAALPVDDRQADLWQNASVQLRHAALHDDDGETETARLAVMRALHRREATSAPRRKLIRHFRM